jgi:hypothetical protein
MQQSEKPEKKVVIKTITKTSTILNFKRRVQKKY